MDIDNGKIWGGIGLLVIGFLLCLTIIGALLGIPLILLGLFISFSGITFWGDKKK